MADRVAVFNEGRIVQVGTPEDIYERPAHALRRRFRRRLERHRAGASHAWTRRAGAPRACARRRSRSRAPAASTRADRIALDGTRARRCSTRARSAGSSSSPTAGRRRLPRSCRPAARDLRQARALRVALSRAGPPSDGARSDDGRRRSTCRRRARPPARRHLRRARHAAAGFSSLLLLVPPLLWLGIVYLGSLVRAPRARASSRSTSSPARSSTSRR